MDKFGRNRIILGILVILTFGALLGRSYPTAGFVVSLAGFIALFLSGVVRAVKGVFRYRRLPPLERAWVALQGVEMIIVVNSIIIHRVPYFAVLVILGAEYLIWDMERRR